MRMNEKEIPERLLFTEIGNNRKRGRPKTRWIDNVTDDFARMGIRNWRRKTQKREIWRKIFENSEALLGL